MTAPDVVDPLVADSAPASRRSRFRRLSLGHLVMIVAGLLAVVLNLSVLRSRDAVYPVVVAESDLEAGAVLTPGDLRVSLVSIDPVLLGRVVTEEDLGRVSNWVTTRDIPAGGVVVTEDLAQPAAPSELRAMSIPIEPANAVGGIVRVGDRIDVIAVTRGQARYVIADAEVLGVSSPATGALARPRDYFITVGLSAEAALNLAAAMANGDIQVVRSTGAPRPDLPESLEVAP